MPLPQLSYAEGTMSTYGLSSLTMQVVRYFSTWPRAVRYLKWAHNEAVRAHWNLFHVTWYIQQQSQKFLVCAVLADEAR